MIGRGGVLVRASAVLVAVAALSACSSASPAEEPEASARADQLVAAAHAAGVAPGLTAPVAASLYGRSAEQLCDALGGGVSSAESLLLTLNPSGRRAKLITDDAITFGELVVQTYCPDELATYDDLVADIHPVEKAD